MIKKLQDFARKDDAVIEVFSEILLTGIIVIAIAAAAAFVLSSLDGPDNVRVDIDHWADEDTNTLYFRHSGGETVNVDDLELVVYVNGSYETLNSSQFNYSSNEWALGDVIEVNTSSQLNYDIDEDNVPSKLVHTASSLVIYDAYGSIGDSGADDGGNGGDDGGGDPLPDGDVAYDDANGNGQYDNGETTYEEDDLISFSNTSVDLVIETEYINQEGTDINIEANSIKLGANITTDKKIDLKSEEDLYIVGATIDAKEDIKIDAKHGLLNATNANITTDKKIDLKSEEDLYIVGATIDAKEDIKIDAKHGLLNATNANITSTDKKIDLKSEEDLYIVGATIDAKEDIKIEAKQGLLNATNANITSTDKKIELKSNGDMYINGATIDAGTEITANLNQENYTLFVDGVEIIDEDDTLIYEPIGEENVDGDPSYGEVEAK